MEIGNYKILEKIGEGGFGITYLAKHLVLGEKACLKQNSRISKEDAQLFTAEAKLMWNLSHHSLPSVRDYWEHTDGSYILAMSYIEGKNLQTSIEKHKAIHPEDVAWMTQRSLNALQYLHRSGVVHGDVKPANIIVQPNIHNAVLVDYGLASIRPHATTQALGYTELFVAPEIKNHKPPIPESDLYSLGATMIYALGGDAFTHDIPDTVPNKLGEFFSDLVRYDPIARPNWDKEDLVAKLSQIRFEEFGRKSTI